MSGDNSITPNVNDGGEQSSYVLPLSLSSATPGHSKVLPNTNSNGDGVKYAQIADFTPNDSLNLTSLTEEDQNTQLSPDHLNMTSTQDGDVFGSKFTYAQSQRDDSEQRSLAPPSDYRHTVTSLYPHGLSTEPDRVAHDLNQQPILRHASSFNRSGNEMSIGDEISLSVDFKLPTNLKNDVSTSTTASNPVVHDENEDSGYVNQDSASNCYDYDDDDDDDDDDDGIANGPVNVSVRYENGCEQSSIVLSGGIRIARGGGDHNILCENTDTHGFEGDEDDFDDYEVGPMHFDQKSVKDMLDPNSPKQMRKRYENRGEPPHQHSVVVDVEAVEDKPIAMSEVRTNVTESQYSPDKSKKGREDCCECILM